MRGGNGESFHRQTTAVPNRPARCQRQIVGEQMNKAALEASADVGGGNMMPGLLHALAHAGNCL